jgi:hypothetical protein
VDYDWLLKETQRQWERNDAKFAQEKADLDKLIASLPPPPAAPQPQSFGNPAVLSVFGPPGCGKTYLLRTDILPRLGLTRKIRHYARVPTTPDRNANVHVFDDVIGVNKDWLRSKEFYDNCSAEDVIIVIDNWTPKTKKRLSYPAAWPSLYAGCWRKFSWWRKFLHRTTDISEMPHISLGRRLGLRATHSWNGQYITPAVSKLESLYFGTLGAYSYNDPDRDVVPVAQMIDSWINDVQADSQVRIVPMDSVPAPEGGYDLEVCLSDLDAAMTAYLRPTSTQYVKATLKMATAFPDYSTIFVVDPNVPDREKAVFDVMSAAYRRCPFSAHIR